MATRSQKVKLGLFVLLSLAMTLVLLLALAGGTLLEAEHRYYVRVPESVEGIQVGSPVSVRGVEVGSVDEIELAAPDPNHVLLTLNVKQDLPLYEGARASLKFRGLTGIKYVDLFAGFPERAPLPPRSRIEYEPSALDRATDQAAAIGRQVSDLAETANRILARVDHWISRVDAERVDQLVRNADGTIREMQGAATQLHQLLRETRKPLRQTLTQVEGTASKSSDVLATSDTTLKSLEQLARELNDLLRSNERDVRATSRNLRQATRALEQLLVRLEQRPSRLLFGSGLPERELP